MSIIDKMRLAHLDESERLETLADRAREQGNLGVTAVLRSEAEYQKRRAQMLEAMQIQDTLG